MRALRRTGGKNEESSMKQTSFIILKGALLAVIFSLICILIFALIIKLGKLDENIVPPVNQVLKIISIVIGSGYAAKKAAGKGWLTGGITGLIYIIFGFILFSLVDGRFNFNQIILSDSLLGIITGAVGGIIGVNIK